MKPDASRFGLSSPSPCRWEADAVAFLREQLLDVEPNRSRALFEFVSPDGTISEVDALVATAAGCSARDQASARASHRRQP